MSLPTLPPDLVLYTRHDYAKLQHLLRRGIKPRLLAFSILAFGPFKGFLNPPSPLPSSSPSSSSSSSSSSFLRLFLCFNGLTLFLCACGIVVSASHLVSSALNTSRNPNSNPSTGHLFTSITAQRKRLASDLSKGAAGVALLVLAALSLALAFPFAGLTVAGDSATLRSAVLFPCFIGGLTLSCTVVFVVKHLLEWWTSFKSDPHLWKAMEEATLFGSLFCKA